MTEYDRNLVLRGGLFVLALIVGLAVVFGVFVLIEYTPAP